MRLICRARQKMTVPPFGRPDQNHHSPHRASQTQRQKVICFWHLRSPVRSFQMPFHRFRTLRREAREIGVSVDASGSVHHGAVNPSAGPYVIDPQAHSHVRCRRSPQAEAMLPTKTRPGVMCWPLPHRCGGRTIHAPSVERTSSPTSLICRRRRPVV